jgi:hypothetical protein
MVVHHQVYLGTERVGEAGSEQRAGRVADREVGAIARGARAADHVAGRVQHRPLSRPIAAVRR